VTRTEHPVYPLAGKPTGHRWYGVDDLAVDVTDLDRLREIVVQSEEGLSEVSINVNMINPAGLSIGPPSINAVWISHALAKGGPEVPVSWEFHTYVTAWDEVLHEAHEKGLIFLLGINNHGTALRVKFFVTKVGAAFVALLP
jgi:hypothetical protein